MAAEHDAPAGGWVETASSIKTFLTCQTKYTFAYLHLRRPRVVSRHLNIGSAFHGIVEGFWQAQLPGSAMPVKETTAAAAHAVLAGAGAAAPLDDFDRQLAARLGIAYAGVWLNTPEGRPVAVEQRFAFPARDLTPLAPVGVTLAGKIDLLLVDDQGYVTTVEHKTAGQEKPGYFERLRLDTQLNVYDEAARRFVQAGPYAGYAGLLYDVVMKPQLKPYKRSENIRYRQDGAPYANQRLEDEAPEAYGRRVRDALNAAPAEHFKRYRLARPQAAQADGKRHLAQALRQIAHVRAYGPTRNPGACFDHNTPCPYFDVCTGVVDLTDDTRFRDAVTHEELTPTAPDGAEGSTP